MSNTILYQELEAQFGRKKMIEFCQILSNMHHLLYLSTIQESPNEHSYERDWWFEKYKELTEKK
jgi:hypothetical protein